MLIETSPTIAYKCSSCGSYAFFKMSMFELIQKKQCSFVCHCQKTSLQIHEDEFSGYKIIIGCIGCGDEHSYILSRRGLLHNTNIFSCPKTGMQLCVLGKDSDVREKVDSIEREMDEIIDEFGYESYFKNTQVMLDSLNKVHDIAEQQKLLCECGNNDIELLLLPDRIYLRCKKCMADKSIYASSNEDLRETLLKQQILLTNPVFKNRLL